MKFLGKLLLLAVTYLMAVNYANAQSGCTNPQACNYSEFAVTDDGSCILPIYLAPLIVTISNDEPTITDRSAAGGGSVAILACLGDVYDQSTYFFTNQECMEQIAATDSFCFEVLWDGICQTAYDECCPDNQWYIPDPYPNLNSGGSPGPFGSEATSNLNPAVLSCSAPPGYVLANQFCALQVIEADDFCVFIDFDSLCLSSYFACAYGCTSPVIAIPDPCSSGIVVFEESPTRGGGGGGSPAILVCPEDLPFGYQIADSQSCAAAVIAQDPFCSSVNWDNVCITDYMNCANGCTYSFACNFSPDAVFDDGSCGYPGCTDAEALNYDSGATCDNGLCVYPQAEGCEGDLDGNGVVNLGDLLIFLSVFGSVCE